MHWPATHTSPLPQHEHPHCTVVGPQVTAMHWPLLQI
jgi:hypothetical protein